MQQQRRTFLAVLLFALIGIGGCATSPKPQATIKPPRPNIIFIMTDDQRLDALSIAGHPFLKTPNIDRIGYEGAYFRNYFVTLPLCSPSRASILTGRYAHANGIKDNRDHSAQSHQLNTFPMMLHDAGYETAFLGKWHMGADATPRPGFDNWICFPGQGRYPNPVFNVNGEKVQKDGYLTDILTDYAIDFLQKKHDRPFLLYIGEKAWHVPSIPAERHKDAYANEPIAMRPNVKDDMKGKPALTRPGTTTMPTNHLAFGVPDETIRNELRTLLAVDEGVGRIYETLKATNQLDNTIIIFTSDNGYFWNEHHLGDKRCAYEEGIRDPLLVRYPKLIQPNTIRNQMVLNVDIAPTLLELAGAKTPENMHGKSMVPLFADPTASWRQSALFEYYLEPMYPNVPTWHGVRNQRWKYIHYDDFPTMDELYNLTNDPYEMENVIADPAHRATLNELKADLERLMNETN